MRCENGETHGVISSPHPAKRPLPDRASPSFQVYHTFSPPYHLPVNLYMARVGARVVAFGLGDMGGIHLGSDGRLDLDLLLTAEMLGSARSVAVGVAADSLRGTGEGEEDGGERSKGWEEHLGLGWLVPDGLNGKGR
jgi:hypothetical protein